MLNLQMSSSLDLVVLLEAHAAVRALAIHGSADDARRFFTLMIVKADGDVRGLRLH